MQNSNEKIQGSLDLSFIRVSMKLWRQTTDMEVPMHDNVKVHIMQNRGRILHNFVETANAWSMLLRGMESATPDDADALEAARAEIKAFGGWANSEIEKLEHFAIGESIIATMDEALLSPEMEKLLKNIWPKPAVGPRQR